MESNLEHSKQETGVVPTSQPRRCQQFI